MKRRRSFKTVAWYAWGEVLDMFDRSRIDEVVAVTAVVAFIVGFTTRINFFQAMLFLCILQVVLQCFDVRKAAAAFKRLRGAK